MSNERNAGRKASLSSSQIQELYKKKMAGISTTELARESGVSRQTLTTYFARQKNNDALIQIDLENPYSFAVTALKYWEALNKSFIDSEKIKKDILPRYSLKYEYMDRDKLMTEILVNPLEKKIKIHNHSNDFLHLAFGVKLLPTYDDFLDFLRERCFPEERDCMKLILKDYGLDSFDLFTLTEMTNGRMAEDHQWLKIYHYTDSYAF